MMSLATGALAAGPRVVFAVGDIHGRYDLLKELLARIVADCLSAPPGRKPIVVFCGDYIDRGPDSAKVLEALTWMKRRDRLETRLLKGNHEQMLLGFLQSPGLYPQWASMGGLETLRSYGVSVDGRAEDPAAWTQMRDELLARMPSSHLYLLQELEPLLVLGRYAFAHAGVRPRRPLERQSERDLLWIRDDFINYQGALPKIVVHGHAWASQDPVLQRYRIGIDTGAYATGVLTAVRLEGAHTRVLQARGPPAGAPTRPLLS